MNKKKYTQKDLIKRIALVVAIMAVVVTSLFVMKFKNNNLTDNDSSYNYDPSLFQGTA